jgi:hypothetical protein
MFISLFVMLIFVFGISGAAFAEIIFEETFNKDASGNLSFPRIVVGEAGPATIVFINGNGTGFNGVKKGSVEFNTEVVYGGLDFKVTGTISKTVALVAGNNALDIKLGGPVGGNMTVQVIQGTDEPTLEFPPGTVFVSPASEGGADGAGCGTSYMNPCETISFALTQGGDQIVVSNGIFTESVHLFDGVDVLGGYDTFFTIRDLAKLKATIIGSPASSATISAININSPTVLEGFNIFAPARSAPSGDSIGIYVENSTNELLIQNNLIFGGMADDGANGDAGLNGTEGVHGGNGVIVFRQLTTDPDVGPFGGGVGGARTVGATNISGGNGGNSFKPSFDVQNGSGVAGSGPTPGGGGSGGFHGFSDFDICGGVILPTNGPFDGTDGGDGADGSDGGEGAGGIAGVVAEAGQDGADGVNGSGGGGGGAGGGKDAHSACDAGGSEVVYGPTGGGGGSGAGAGAGGVGGGGGGGSFGIFVDSTGMPIIGSNEIFLGFGGDGGHGGFGGIGGTGGIGGLGGPGDGQNGNGIAGNGGYGGNGGHGGGAGGGAGGFSVGIFANFNATGTYNVDNVIHIETGSAGDGGTGGFSLGNSGLDGGDGSVNATLFQ